MSPMNSDISTLAFLPFNNSFIEFSFPKNVYITTSPVISANKLINLTSSFYMFCFSSLSIAIYLILGTLCFNSSNENDCDKIYLYNFQVYPSAINNP